MQGLVRRLGLVTFRLMMLFTTIREFDTPDSTKTASDGSIVLECSSEDFWTSICISETLLYHSVYSYVKLKSKGRLYALANNESGVNARRYALFDKLPHEFDKSTFDKIVQDSNENINTAYKWIDKYIQDGKLERSSKGFYQKKET